jgi:ketosteroid isomerase-like protein
VDRDDFDRWIGAYERAWRTPGTEALRDLFSDEATYSTAPFERPYEGLEAIAAFWEEEREGPDEAFEMSWALVAVEGDTGVARVDVAYGDPKPRRYRDLWVIRLDPDGRCRTFEEWPFWPPGSVGTHAPGPAES